MRRRCPGEPHTGAEKGEAQAAEAGRGRLLILLLAYTGLRWGEATALRVCDIDLERRRVDVRRAFSDVGGRVILGTPKSHQSPG